MRAKIVVEAGHYMKLEHLIHLPWNAEVICQLKFIICEVSGSFIDRLGKAEYV